MVYSRMCFTSPWTEKLFPIKKTLLQNPHLQSALRLTAEHMNKGTDEMYDETKVELLTRDTQIHTVKHDGGSIMPRGKR